MLRVGTARPVPGREAYKRIAEAEVLLVRSLDEVRNKTRFSNKSGRLSVVRDSEISSDARLPRYQQKCVERTPCTYSTEKPPLYREATFQMACRSVDITAAEEVRGLPDFIVPEERRSNVLKHLSERQQGRHHEAVTSLRYELDCIAREMEPLVLEPGHLLQKKLMESDRKIELLLKEIELDASLEGFSIEGLEELWNVIRQEYLNRRKWIRETDESLMTLEKSRADKITNVLRKYTLVLEEIGALVSDDVHRFMNDEAMRINRDLLANKRETAKLFFSLMKSEMNKEFSHRLKWQDRVKDWKMIRKNSVVHSFREFMANEEIQNPPTVKTEVENMKTQQNLFSQRRLEILQQLGDLLPPTHTKADVEEWYRSLENVNKTMDTHHEQSMTKIRLQYESIQEKCLAELQLYKNNLLNLNIWTKEEVEEIVGSELSLLTEQLRSRFEEELQLMELMDRDFKELATQNEQSCKELYSYFQEAMALWDIHQQKLSQQEDDLQKKLDECRCKEDNIIQKMDADLDIILTKVKTASSEEKLKSHFKKALSSLDQIRARYGRFSQVLMDEVTAYPEAVLQELISYSESVSQYFNVKEVFKQDVLKSRETESSDIPVETFSTSSGNSYTVLGAEEAEKSDKETVFVELKKRIRLCFFEHLEKWFAESVSRSHDFVAAKEEELTSELQLRLHSDQQRRKNIETNICDARAAELALHKEDLERHCAGVLKALETEKAEFLKMCKHQKKLGKNLQSQICDMDSVFLSAARTEKLASFSNTVHSELQSHLETIQASLRSYRKKLEEALGKLKDSNVEFLEACRLSLEGGNFSPQELKSVSKHLQRETKRIDAFEKIMKLDIDKLESSCLKQATELISKAETKFRYILMNREFMEKIKQSLGKLRIQIKSEVANSRSQAATLKSSLEELHQKIEACTHPAADKETLTSEELYDFTKGVLRELKKRSQYLDCVLVKAVRPLDKEDFAPLASNVKLQGPIAAAIRTERLRDKSRLTLMGLDHVKYPLLNPSRMGKSALDDLSIGVIKSLLDIQPSRKASGPKRWRDHSHLLEPVTLPTSKKNSHEKVSEEGPGESTSGINATWNTRKLSDNEKMPTRRMQHSGNRFQLFGEKPSETETFKGIIMNLLWTGNNSLLCLAEKFYREKNPQITVPEDLPKTFEGCVQLVNQTLLSYHHSTEDYYSSCLTEFQEQLHLFEKELVHVSQLVVDGLLKEHEQKLRDSIDQVRQQFHKQLEDWEKVKVVHKCQLNSSLGHPKNLPQLEALCQEEAKRQRDQVDGIHLNTHVLQDCAAECARNFVSALAALTEKLLLDLDENITSDEIQAAKTEAPKEKPFSLLPQRQAGLPLDTCDIERGSRTWPGIPMITLPDNSDSILCRETASVTTAKTTLGHVAAVEARDAAYKKYKCQLEQHFSQMREESTAQLLAVQGWEEWWKRSVQKIKTLYA